MKLRDNFFLLLICCICWSAGFAQGLKFNSAELPIDKRTSYNVFAERTPPTFNDRFVIEFEMALYPVTEIGYILRIKNEGSQKIYNLFYDGQGDDFFKLNEEGKCNLITAKINRQELLDAHWFRMSLSFDLIGDSISLTVHNRTFTATKVGLPDHYRPVIVFGKSDHIIDVPSFAIQHLGVGNQTRYLFPLTQNQGEAVFDTKGRALGRVVNPEWLINDAYHWRYHASFSSQRVAGANYNPLSKEVYYFNRDTLHCYNLRTEQYKTIRFAEPCPVNLILGTNFLDAAAHKLYAYEVYDDVSPAGGVSVASLDLVSQVWSEQSTQRLPTQLHHHSLWFDSQAGRYTIFGGFGNMRYSSEFQIYDIQSHQWHPMAGISGDPLFPRYFSSMGYQKSSHSLYIFGGMGNESGDQSVGRYYFYDLHRLDLATGVMSKLWEIPWEKTNSVPVRTMIVGEDAHFYTLCYPESVSDSYLRLYRFSIKDGSYEILGDSIPIHSDKITTNANLYFDAQQNMLVATVQEFDDDDIRSRMNVYTLSYPPITAAQLASYAKPAGDKKWWYIGLLVFGLAAGGGGFYGRYRMKQRKSALCTASSGGGSESPTRPNSISLFGDFMVRDRQNRDITYLFTGRQKQAFCLILQHSMTEGITSQRLSNLLWPDKPEDKVKNSRGVAINHLRKSLCELDDIELIFHKGCFKLIQGPTFYCDYSRCMEIIISEDIGEYREEFLQLISRGKFLAFSDQPLFDSFKEELEYLLEPVLQREMERSFVEENYAATIVLAEAIFHIDPLDEGAISHLIRALNRQKKGDLAYMRYQTFILEYKKTTDRDYPQPFRNF